MICGIKDSKMIFTMVFITTQLLIFLTIISIIITAIISSNQYSILIEWEIITTSTLTIILPVIIDTTSILFIRTVLLIATRVIQFSKRYIATDKTINRFILLVLIFVISIIFLILFPHTIILLIGWDGLGITSFVLVIYYNNSKRLGAGIVTALTNRIGDVILLIAIALIFNQGHWLITEIWHNRIVNWVSRLILIAAITKRAQIPFSSWLPAAIAAPTPVRALVHSSTLVTAGVYLLYRFSPLIETWQTFKPCLIFVATITILIAGAGAITECDIKKIIALSTLSQVALIIFTLRIGLPEIAFFHLITHALFKALLFICAGNLIDIHHHNQNLRTMGNITSQIPVIATAITISNIALCGAPFLAGFYSKDLIIETITILNSTKSILIIIIFTTATILTTAYSTRFILYTIISNTTRPAAQYSSETITQVFSVIILRFIAVCGGAITNWLTIVPVVEPNFRSLIKIGAISIIILGVVTGTYRYSSLNVSSNLINNFLCYMWFLTPVTTHLIPKNIIYMPLKQIKLRDQGWSLIPLLLFSQSYKPSSILISSQNNTIINNILRIFIVITWLIWTILCLSSLN